MNTQEHLAALDLVYQGVIETYRKGVAELDDLDWVEAFMILRERLPDHEFPVMPGEEDRVRYPTIQAFIDYLATELTWD